jgi:hypothetical protein
LLRQLLPWLRASAGRCSGNRETDSAAGNSSAPVHSAAFLQSLLEQQGTKNERRNVTNWESTAVVDGCKLQTKHNRRRPQSTKLAQPQKQKEHYVFRTLWELQIKKRGFGTQKRGNVNDL